MKFMKKISKFTFGLIGFSFLLAAVAQAQAAQVSQPVTPNDVYAEVSLLNQYADQLMAKYKVTQWQKPVTKNTGLSPMHAYQMLLADSSLMHEYELALGLSPMPIITATPMQYYPADALTVADLMVQHMHKVLQTNDIEYSTKKQTFTDKTPSDVFAAAAEFYSKLEALDGIDNFTPSQVYAQMNRINRDVVGILVQLAEKPDLSPEQSSFFMTTVFRAVPKKELEDMAKANKTPADVYDMTILIRKSINVLKSNLKLPQTPVPKVASDKVTPFDVFLQTQIILAELNTIKGPLKVRFITPVAIPTTGKTSNEVYQQALIIEYLLQRLHVYLGMQEKTVAK